MVKTPKPTNPGDVKPTGGGNNPAGGGAAAGVSLTFIFLGLFGIIAYYVYWHRKKHGSMPTKGACQECLTFKDCSCATDGFADCSAFCSDKCGEACAPLCDKCSGLMPGSSASSAGGRAEPLLGSGDVDSTSKAFPSVVNAIPGTHPKDRQPAPAAKGTPSASAGAGRAIPRAVPRVAPRAAPRSAV
jgi:hypothetical protein